MRGWSPCGVPPWKGCSSCERHPFVARGRFGSEVDSSANEEGALRPEPDRLAARRQRAERGREPPASATGCCCGSTTPTPARNVEGGEEAILDDLGWLGVEWDEGPVRQSERQERYREAAAPLGERFDGITLLREDGTATYQLASVVDDVDFGITHVIRGNDHRPNEALHRRLHEALGTTPPEYVHHGLILGEDGKKLSKRAPRRHGRGAARGGHPAPRPCARTSRSWACRSTTSASTSPRIRRLAIEAIAGACRRGARGARGRSRRARPRVLRGARDLNEAREYAAHGPRARRRSTLGSAARPTLERFRELRERRERRARRRTAQADRPRAEGGRRRPAGAAARADRAGARPRALGGRRRAVRARRRCGGSMRLYNTLSRAELDELPEPPGPVRMYVCGPTVYARAHVGNARAVRRSACGCARWLRVAAATT